MAKYTNTFNIGYMDLDNSMTLSNRAMLGFLEDVATYHGNLVGTSILNIDETKLSWILLGWHLEVIKRAKCLEDITIETYTVPTSKKLYSIREFKIYNSSKELIATATSKWILYDIIKSRPIKLSDELIGKFEPETEGLFNYDDLTFKLDEQDGNLTYTYKVSRRDIDVNNHMHNIYYIDLAYEAISEHNFNNTAFNKVDIMYRKEFKYNDSIKCYLHEDEQNVNTVMLKDTDGTTHAIVKLYN